jgi:hypothetical protein
MRIQTVGVSFVAIVIGTGGVALAQEVSFGAQVRPRTEYRDPVGGGDDAFTSMRVRAHVNANLRQNVRVFIQLQDVRIWGEESNTLGDFKANDWSGQWIGHSRDARSMESGRGSVAHGAA